MGQAPRGIYSLLGSRCRNLRLRELLEAGEKNGARTEVRALSPPASHSGLEAHGPYLLLENATVPALWGSIYSAVTQRAPLVLLPPSSPLERELLLAQLPANPPREAVLVLFTSGTTGNPKAILHSEASLLASTEQLLGAFPGSGPTCSLLRPWSMAGVIFHCLLPAARGSDVLYSPLPFSEWAPGAARIFEEEKVEFLTLNPFLLEQWLRFGGTGAYAGQVVSLTSPLRANLAAEFKASSRAVLLEIFGMTEAAGPVLLEGKSLGTETRLSAEGELELSGDQLFLGSGSEGAFQARDAWFATGDLFELREGRLQHRARTRELIDIGGRKVAPQLIEAAFERMPEIAECLAFGKEIASVQRVGLVYVRKPGCRLSEAELSARVEQFAKENLSRELRPHWWQECEKVPRLPSGKPDRKRLSDS